MGFSTQEYSSRLPFPHQGDIPTSGMEPKSLPSPHWQEGSLPRAPSGKVSVSTFVNEPQSCWCPSTCNDSLASGSPTAGQTYPHVRNPWLYVSSIHQQTGHLPDASAFPSCSLHEVLAASEVGGGAASRTSSSLGLAFLCGEKPVAQHHG